MKENETTAASSLSTSVEVWIQRKIITMRAGGFAGGDGTNAAMALSCILLMLVSLIGLVNYVSVTDSSGGGNVVNSMDNTNDKVKDMVAVNVVARTDESVGWDGKVHDLPRCAVCDGDVHDGNDEDEHRRYRSCHDLYAAHPKLDEECMEDPKLTKCNVMCQDNGKLPPAMPKKSTNKDGKGCPETPDSGKDSPVLGTLWPQLDETEEAAVTTLRGGESSSSGGGAMWVRDDKYCEEHRGTTRECFLGRYRYDIPATTTTTSSGCEGKRQRRDSSSAPEKFYPMDHVTACELLHRHNVTDIKVSGDSLQRHLWQGLAIALKGDMEHSFRIINPKDSSIRYCHGQMAFSENKCQPNFVDNRHGLVINVCPIHSLRSPDDEGDGKASYTTTYVKLRYQKSITYRKGHHPRITSEVGRGRTLHVYGVGTGPPHGKHDESSRLGAYNATLWYKEKWSSEGFETDFGEEGNENNRGPYFWNRPNYPLLDDDFSKRRQYYKQSQYVTSSSSMSAPQMAPSSFFVWVPPHYKMSVGRFDESNHRALHFMKETHDMFESRYRVPTLNTFDMTKHAVRHFCRRCDRFKSSDAVNNGADIVIGNNDENDGGSGYVIKMIDSTRNCRYYARDDMVVSTNRTGTTASRSTCAPTLETLDGVHYGRSINVWKSHLLLYHFQHMLSKYQ